MGSRSDFFIAEKCHPTVKWREEEPEIDPEELAKVKVAFVRNLPTDMNEDFLKKIFGSFGELEKVVLSKKNQSHVGFVHFAKRSDLDIAIRQLNDKTVPGVGAGSSFKLQVEVARPLDKSRKRAHDTSNHATSTVSQFKVLKGVEGSPSLSGRVLKDLEEPVVADPYEAAVVSLPGPVIDRLLRIMRLGIATRFDIDIQCLRTLKELPESSAISVLDQFMLSGADEIEKGAYLARLIAKYRVKMVETSPIQFYESRASDIVTAGAELPSLSSRSLLSAAEPPLPPQSAILSSRYEPYVPRVSYLDYSPSTRAGLSRTEERNPSPLHRLSGSSPPSYGRLGIGTTLPATLPRQSQPGISRVEEMNLSPLHHLSGSSPPRYGGSGISSALPTTTPRESTRPRVRFDPFTGQPYKFDPFTGEPIVPESNPGHSRGLY